MVQKRDRILMYGDVKKVITEEIGEVGLIKYLMRGNRNWVVRIYKSITWDHVGRYMNKLTGQRLNDVANM